MQVLWNRDFYGCIEGSRIKFWYRVVPRATKHWGDFPIGSSRAGHSLCTSWGVASARTKGDAFPKNLSPFIRVL